MEEKDLQNEASLNNVSGDVVDNTDYVTAIKELKQNSVSKEKYDALVAEKKNLLDALVNGKEVSAPEAEVLEPRETYYQKYKENKFSNDLEYWDNFIKLRKATIKECGADPCVTGNYGLTPDGGRMEPSYGEEDSIRQQMEIMEGFVKEADGNPNVFEALLQSSLPKR